MRKVVTTGITALGIASASFALTVLNPFSASAQTDTPSTTAPAQTEPTTPTTPGTPAPATPAPRDHEGNCPNMGGDSGTQTAPDTSGASSSASPAAFRVRSARY
ncbi:MAG: hypothetical protein ABIQ73_30395 [Acidimicrobiales bacterium]